MANNLLIKNILEPKNENKYVWNIINNSPNLSPHINLPNDIKFSSIEDYISIILGKQKPP